MVSYKLQMDEAMKSIAKPKTTQANVDRSNASTSYRCDSKLLPILSLAG